MMRWLVLPAALLIACSLKAHGQDTQAKLAFDVASVKQSKADDGASSANVPLGPGNVYAPTDGAFNAQGFPLIVYVQFAYRMNDAQIAAFLKQVPDWVKAEHFDIQARTERASVSKDELRFMMRSLLAERFGLAVHTETHEVQVYELRFVKAGEPGPSLRVHPSAVRCPISGEELKTAEPEALPGGFPAICGAILGLPAKGQGNYRIGGSNIPMKLLADSLTGWGGLNKPVLDRTGIERKIDFVLEYAPLARVDANEAADAEGTTFQEALKRQLGLRLEAGKGPVELLVLDSISHPTAN